MPWTREEKIFCVTTYLETKSLKTVSNYQYDNDLFMRQETQKKIACPGSWYNNNFLKKHWFDVSSSKDAFFTGCVSNDRHWACFSKKSLSYLWVASILRHPIFNKSTQINIK